MTKKFHLSEFGYEAQIGKYACQADGAVWLQQGGTVVLATVVSAPAREFPGFLPLTIEYREPFSAAGKIPGGYFKREGKPTDSEVLTGRLIDRAVRPLFPTYYFNQVQIVTTVYSVDKVHAPATLGLIASSLALSISKIPFMGPVAVVEVVFFEGTWIVDPTHQQSQKAATRLMIAGTAEGICMVEGSADEIKEEEFVRALAIAHAKIVEIAAWQSKIQQEIGHPKEPLDASCDWTLWEQRIDAYLTQEKLESVYIANKVDRNAHLDSLRSSFKEIHQEEITQKLISDAVIQYIFDQVLHRKISELIIAINKRVDGRSPSDIRTIQTEVGLLPCTHGSALFTRGRTQLLVSVTLGGGEDEQRIERLMPDEGELNGSFMLHYNFPPFSVGEARPMRGPGRREVGHGSLAASALRGVLPDKETFAYTIRIVADALESDGSTSMATVCGATMALMQGGVPIEKMVAGIAMGLLKSTQNKFLVLSDISGFEDAFGLMDFKVAGTDNGITAIQMDIKYKGGLPLDVFSIGLAQARVGRLHILGEMRKVMTVPNSSLSELVPRLVSFKINSDKIGAVIGTGGKVIREIIEKTGTKVDIESDGLVKILAGPDAKLEKAINWIKTLSGQIETGAVYEGPIRKIAEFGMFVELVPGQDGLVHKLAIPRDRQRNFAQYYNVGDIVKVRVEDYDPLSGRVRLRIVEDDK